MAALVHLVRHGEVHNPEHLVYASLPGYGLSDRGRSQAAASARHLGSQPVVAVWSSPLERALETAGIVARRFGLPVRSDDRLVEWQLMDRWAGKCWESLNAHFPGELDGYLQHPEHMPFTPETLSDLASRVRVAVEDLASRHLEGDIVVVGHQDPIQAARLSFSGTALSKLHIDKPAHGSIVSLRPSAGWSELGMWSPD
ncbi:MAG: histidine phosphatase family protein [Acidimicrobiia bacterium]|nr:histidine phosphatase family protein [Acidimicrobiia bacterium]MDH4308148.1 histidine phosphatase family protein [Acidimicrobiia bacterium]MDH5293335.1 histidine phosphatase family protein [Acidimicrobiia bacterium]